MARRAVFLSEPSRAAGVRGLSALTEPDHDEPVAAIVDVPVIGARGDGKTQFIVHAIRTLRAYGPELAGAEAQYHREIMRVVLDARAPRPDATTPGVVPHYVFRIRPAALLDGVGALGRLRLLAATTRLASSATLLAAGGLGLAAGLIALGAAPDVAAVGATAASVSGGALIAARARRQLAAGDVIEVVFWDVAGEHVYSSSAAEYHAFLDTLVRERRRRAGARRHAFAPVLLCNPLGLGVHREGSPYARLRQILPMFAALEHGDTARALVAVNRWSLVEGLCAPDADRDEVVAVIERRRGDDASTSALATATAASASASVPVVPSVRREVVRAWCRDAEDGRDDDVDITHLRYDAASRCEIRTLAGGDEDDAAPAPSWRARDATVPPTCAVEYRWEDAPGAFHGEARRVFLGWLGALAYGGAPVVAEAGARRERPWQRTRPRRRRQRPRRRRARMTCGRGAAGRPGVRDGCAAAHGDRVAAEAPDAARRRRRLLLVPGRGRAGAARGDRRRAGGRGRAVDRAGSGGLGAPLRGGGTGGRPPLRRHRRGDHRGRRGDAGAARGARAPAASPWAASRSCGRVAVVPVGAMARLGAGACFGVGVEDRLGAGAWFGTGVEERLGAAVVALWHGGAMAVDDAAPELLAVAESWLPDEVRERPRRIVLGAGREPATVLGRWLAGAMLVTGPAAARIRGAWRVASALARTEGVALERLVDELDRLHRAWDPARWSHLVHRWGRGVEAPTGELTCTLARRAVADRLFADGRAAASRWRRELRRTALLPAERAAALERAVVARLPALAGPQP